MRQELEVMRILRVPPIGKLVVEVNGERFESIDEIADEHGKRRLLAAIGELIGFVGNYSSLVEAGVAPPLSQAATPPPPSPTDAPPPEPTETHRQAEQPESEAVSPEQVRFLAQLEAQRDAIRESHRATASDTGAAAASPPTADRRPAAKQPLTVAAQIDLILQEMKANNPDLAGRTIRLRQNPAGGLHIEVDGKFYQEPGEIEERAVQQIIQEAVQAWRNS